MNKPVEKFRITNFINQASLGGIILIIVTIIALIWANSPFYESYHHVWHEVKVGFVWGKIDLVASIHHWINDGLMALFFFTVGLEIKREVMGGELSSIKKASLPLAAAVGGMVFPAAIYAAIMYNYPEFSRGWGIPMATDIAFALGLLSMLGSRVHINLKIFLTALAIADDLGAVMVIAIFYTDQIVLTELLSAGFFLLVLSIANMAGVRRSGFYALIGFTGVWLAFIFSGVHATIAGVLIAMTIPARTKIDEAEYATRLNAILDKFKKEPGHDSRLLSKSQVHLLAEMDDLNRSAYTPLQRLEHNLHPMVTYFILPVFALSNAGVHIEGNIADMLFHPISLGIIFGLVIGKLFGISLLSKIMVRLKLASLPEGVKWPQIYAAAALAGIGFTMSMFIADLAFIEAANVQIAKVGILAASLISAIIGMGLLVLTTKSSKAENM